jgi:Zinc carboxypeptidase
MGKARTAALLVLLASAALAQSRPATPTPAEFLGFEPGTDRKLADYHQVYAYFEKLAATTDRVKFASIGKTTEGNEMGFAIISSAQNLANVEEIRKTNLALVDPRKLKAGDAEGLLARGKTIVCINSSIHSTEVGPTQASLPLAHFLATTQDPEWLKVLDDVVLLMIPCHNPDGYLKVVDWYRRYVGTPHEGCTYPGLYHRYAGHDNNRDWFMFNLQETRLTVEQVYQRWVPQIVIDQHQMQDDGARMFVPPYQDPVEPNVDPILITNLNELGRSVQKGLIAKGLTGIVTNSIFDAWSPSRAYMHYHGGVRFLCEVASCRTATPIEKKGLDRRATTRPDLNPAPWSGERWSLGDIIRYHQEAAMAVLRHASANRERWIKGFHEVFKKACSGDYGPEGFVIRQYRSEESPSLGKLLDVLELGGVEVFRSLDSNDFDDEFGKRRPAIVIPGRQPFFPFARALLERTEYPAVRETETGPIRKPYDLTAHCIPLLFDLDVRPYERRLSGRLERIVPSAAGGGRRADKASSRAGAVGVYQSSVPNVMDAGWLRLWLEEQQVPYRLLGDPLMRGLSLQALAETPLEVLLLPSLTSDQIVNGNRAEEFPPEYRGGIGDAGSAALDRWVRDGGTLIAIKEATALPINLFKLPTRNALSNLPEGRRLTIPGAILRLKTDLFGVSIPTLFDGGKAFEPDPTPERDQTIKPVVDWRWAAEKELRLAGYADGLDLLAGKAAVVRCDVGKGQVILFGFSPHFRCQTRATFPLLEHAIREGLERN